MVPEFATTKPWQINVPPFVIVRAPLRLEFPDCPKVTIPDAVKIEELLNCKVAVPLPDGDKNKLLHTAVAMSTVTVCP